jgi:ABC-type lipoprotein export system ATPase subunit
MVTHDPHTAEYAGRTLHLEKGRLVRDASNGRAIEAEPEEATI